MGGLSNHRQLRRVTIRGESFRKPNTNIQYTISPRNPIQYNIQYFPIFILGQYKYWFLRPNILAQYTIFFLKKVLIITLDQIS